MAQFWWDYFEQLSTLVVFIWQKRNAQWSSRFERKILWLEKIKISPVKIPPNNLWHAQIKQWLLHIIEILGEIKFRSKLRLKTSEFFVSKLLFRHKKKLKGHVDI